MTLWRMAGFTCLTFAALATQAMALSTDDKTLANGDASRFSDPDEREPAAGVTLYRSQTARIGENKDGAPSNAADPSSVRYEYDKDSGNYIPRH